MQDLTFSTNSTSYHRLLRLSKRSAGKIEPAVINNEGLYSLHSYRIIPTMTEALYHVILLIKAPHVRYGFSFISRRFRKSPQTSTLICEICGENRIYIHETILLLVRYFEKIFPVIATYAYASQMQRTGCCIENRHMRNRSY